MRIIKQTANSYRRIAEAMINTEMGAEVFIDGKIQPKGASAYPKFNVGAIEYRVKATSAYIYTSAKPEDAFNALRTELTRLDVEVENSTWAAAATFQTVSARVHTNIKARGAAPRRHICVADPDVPEPEAQFVWRVAPIDKFDYVLDASTVDVISRYIASIFYDNLGICKLEDGAFVSEFSRNDFIGMNAVLNETVFLSSYYNPIAFEVNESWLANCPSVGTVLDAHRNVNPGRIFTRNWADTKLAPTVVAANDIRDDVCSSCHAGLYGDIYVLHAPQKQPDYRLGTPVCPLCMHLGEKKYEAKYFYVFRVTYPRTLDELVSGMKTGDARKAVLRAAARGIKHVKHHDVEYWTLGDEYLAFHNVDKYLYSELSTTNKMPVVVINERIDTHRWVLQTPE